MKDTMQHGVSGSLPRSLPRSLSGSLSRSFTCELTGDAADCYLDRVSGLIRAAHLNAYFPSTAALLGHLSALHSRTHGGLYPQLSVDVTSGLPTSKEWTRVKTDVELAESILPRLPTPVMLDNQTTDQGFGEQLLKLLYCSRLPSLGLGPLYSVRVDLREIDVDTGTADVRIIIDKIDMQGLPSRCTIELCETPQSADAASLLCRSGEALALAHNRRAQLLRLADSDAETLFIELSAMPGVVVNRVSRGTIGPFCLAELPAAIPFGALLNPPRGALGTFALDVAARDLGHDGTSDPLAHMLLSGLSTESLASREQARLRLGYRVYCDRKFAVDLAAQPALESLCHAAGTRNVIYTTALVRPGTEAAS